MIRLDGQPILTAARMRAAEAPAIAASSVDALMSVAGRAVAAAVHRLAGASEVLVLCGPGNNGGDGYVAATMLRGMGVDVRVAAIGVPGSPVGATARAAWGAEIETLADVRSAPILVDALFGIGLSRPLDETIAASWRRLAAQARLHVAVDLPSGLATDDGSVLTRPPRVDVTLALGAPKPAHVLQPGARWCGRVRVLDIGVACDGDAHVIARPTLPAPGPDSHKFSRGMVAVIAGAMPGASLLAGIAAMRSGAGYVALIGGSGDGQGPHALVHRASSDEAWSDERIGAMIVGPGLGRDDDARAKLQRALVTQHPLVIDGDALHFLKDGLPALAVRPHPSILTPHAGEFAALFGDGEGSKIDRARVAAKRANAVVVFKGADTVIAAPDGRVVVSPDANDWLSTAGTGDVLTGAVAASLAAGLDPFEAAAAGVWMHGQASRRLGASFIADDLADALSAVRARP